MKRCLLALAPLIAAAGLSCRHNPVYPEIGTLYIESLPSTAEVIIDGQPTRRMTPVRLDGIAAGVHEIRLRYFGYKVSRDSVIIGKGTTKRLSVKLAPVRIQEWSVAVVGFAACHLAYEPANRRVYVANGTRFLDVLGIDDGRLARLGTIEVNTGNVGWIGTKLVAASAAAGRIYAVLAKDSIVAYDIGSHACRRRFKLADSTRFVQLRFSADGRRAYVADSLNRRIWQIDTATDSITGHIPLGGVPSDFICDPVSGHLYVTLSSTQQLVDLGPDGTVWHTIPTGPAPGGLFHDQRWEWIGFCRTTEQRPVFMSLSTWAPAAGPVIHVATAAMTAGFYALDQTHILVTSTTIPYVTAEGWACDSGRLSLIYRPTQQFVTSFRVLPNPVATMPTADGKYMLLLSKFDGMIMSYRIDTE